MGLRTGAARMLGRLIRVAGLGGGTTLPGRALLTMDRSALERLGSGLSQGSVLVSATNGKTTTSAMLARILAETGQAVLTNREGSNMPWGIATALLGDRDAKGVFEVDEAWLPKVAASLVPDVIVLGNLFRDQLDRYGETERIADRWTDLARSSPVSTTFVLNADDPLIVGVGASAGRSRLLFGLDDPDVALAAEPHASDARRCRNCDARLVFERNYLGHLGIYHCPECGTARPTPDLTASAVDLKGTDGVSATIAFGSHQHRLELPLPGLYNLYNALGAIAGAISLGLDLGQAVTALSTLPPVFGRAERLDLEGAEGRIFLIKNPVGANEVLRTLGSVDNPFDLWIALNDRIADGRDVSWIWDADFEQLSRLAQRVTCSGTRAAEMALRLKYAGLERDRLVIDPALGDSFDRADPGPGGTLFALPTYTALLELKEHLARDGGSHYWEKGNGK